MRPRFVLVRDQEALALCADAPAPEAQPVSRIPGASRRDWVYREMALLGPDALPWVEDER